MGLSKGYRGGYIGCCRWACIEGVIGGHVYMGLSMGKGRVS